MEERTNLGIVQGASIEDSFHQTPLGLLGLQEKLTPDLCQAAGSERAGLAEIDVAPLPLGEES